MVADSVFREEQFTWQNLRGTLISTPTVTSWDENRLDIFGIGMNGRLYHKWWNGDQWSGWENLGGTCINRPAAVSYDENRLDVFAIGIDRQIYHKWWDGSQWNGWKSLGGDCAYGIAATSWGKNRIDLFSVDADNVLRHKYFEDEWQPEWNAVVADREDPAKQREWVSSIYPPAAVSLTPNHISIFSLGIDGQVYHAWGDGETWSGWQSISGRPGWRGVHGVAATSQSESNRIDLFISVNDAQSLNYRLYHRFTTSVLDYSAWSAWTEIEGAICIAAPAAIARSNNQIDIFLIGPQRALYQKSATQTNKGLGEASGPNSSPLAPPTILTKVVNTYTPTVRGQATLGEGDVLTVSVSTYHYELTFKTDDTDFPIIIESDGNWSFTIPSDHPLPEYGPYPTVTATVINTASDRTSTATKGELIIDPTPPVPLTINPLITRSSTPAITGTTAILGIDETLVVVVNNISYINGDGHLLIENDNSWTLTIPEDYALPDGVYEVSAMIVDTNGQQASESTKNELIVNTTPTPVPTVNSQTANSATPTVTGTATLGEGETLTVEVNGIIYSAGDGNLIVTRDNNTWTLNIPEEQKLANGIYTVTATITDGSGNRASSFTKNELVIKIYTTIQFIGYGFKTGVLVNDQGIKFKCKEYDAVKVISAKRNGLSLLEKALAFAYDDPAIQQDDSCLKVFVIPEFFFSYIYPINSTFASADYFIGRSILSQLRDITRDPKYNDWLFVFGTFLGLVFTTGSKLGLLHNNILIQKSMIQDQTYDDPESYLIISQMNFNKIEKENPTEYESLITIRDIQWEKLGKLPDFYNGDFTDYSGENPIKIGENDRTWYCEKSSLEILEVDSKTLFKRDGITFGLEASLDQVFLSKIIAQDEIPQFQIVFFSGDDRFNNVPQPKLNHRLTFVIDGYTGRSKLGNVNSYITSTKSLPLNREGFEDEWDCFVDNQRSDLGVIHVYEPQEINPKSEV